MRKIANPTSAPITRRTVLQGALAATASLAASPLLAQQMQTHLPPGVAPKPKGPLVYRDYDQEELDMAYDQIPWAPNRDEILGKRSDQMNAATIARLGPPRRLAYGPAEIEKLDLYAAPNRPNAPMHVFIHGGTWRIGSAAGQAHYAEIFVDRGAHFIALDFTNVIETKGNLTILAQQVRRAVAWIYRNAASFGGDPDRLYLSGHSSGGHLAGVVLTTDWQKDFGLPANPIKAGLLISGMFDLYPVSLSARRNYVNFTPEVIEELSPQRHLDKLSAPIIVAHGTLETPEFQRQARDFAAAVRAAGKPVTLLVGQGYNHFELPETLANPYGLLGRAVLQQMELTA